MDDIKSELDSAVSADMDTGAPTGVIDPERNQVKESEQDGPIDYRHFPIPFDSHRQSSPLFFSPFHFSSP